MWVSVYEGGRERGGGGCGLFQFFCVLTKWFVSAFLRSCDLCASMCVCKSVLHVCSHAKNETMDKKRNYAFSYIQIEIFCT